jgi:hypothetical protein
MSEDDLTSSDSERLGGEVERLMRQRPEPRAASAAPSEPEVVVDFTRKAPPGYTIVRPIHGGGMSKVYLATDLIGRTVILKTLGTNSKEALAALVREGRAMARVARHANVVFIYNVAELSGFVPFIVMEHVAGRPLTEHLHEFRGKPKKAAALAAQIADGIEHAHANNVVHRDLKPDNVMVYETKTGELFPIVIDFGVAKLVDEAGLTRTDEAKGTLVYMSPEQWRGGAGVDHRTDIYSLGVLLFELVCGERPVAFRNMSQYRDDVQAGKLRKINDIVDGPHVDDKFQSILARCLEVDPKHRYQTMGEVSQVLGDYLQGDMFTVERDTLGAYLRRFWQRNEAKLRIAKVAAVVALVLGVAAAAVVWRATAAAAAKAQAAEAQRHAAELRQQAAEAQARHGVEVSARLGAQRFLGEFHHFAAAVVAGGDQPTLRRALRAWRESAESRPGRTPEQVFAARARRPVQDFLGSPLLPKILADGQRIENWQALDGRGRMIARWPDADTGRAVVGHDLSARDYFRGAREHVGRAGVARAHVALAYESRADFFIKAAVSVAILDGDGSDAELLGVLAGSTTTDPLPDRQDPDEQLIEVAPFEGRADGKITPDPRWGPFVVLVHPALERKRSSAPFKDELLAPLALRSPGHELDDPSQPPAMVDDFHDPLDPNPTRRWRIAAAPIGRTGYLAIVKVPVR